MGLWDYISSTANSTNQNVIKPICNLGSTSFSYASDAFTKIGSVAVQTISHNWHDQDARFNIGQFATNIAKNTAVLACSEGLKTFPGGGPILEIIRRSQPEYKTTKNHKKEEIMELKSELEVQKEKIKELQDLADKMGKELRSFKREFNQAELCAELDKMKLKTKLLLQQESELPFHVCQALADKVGKELSSFKGEFNQPEVHHQLDEMKLKTKLLQKQESEISFHICQALADKMGKSLSSFKREFNQPEGHHELDTNEAKN
ncbi:hypothetical protein P3X46_015532 [Hevea brasiliensis]|uniref:Uncharacterized protein n=1 Tax=Hevea brasiliensis TaxID=3981 RepID=A0ABQ9LW80_HEVBR|nr:uncharacterized protein LOC110658029 [Hevea brasiliensis]KAJ9172276.1 hypothetical protein P3X46_015532 [Hevea brasiliensis]